MAAIIHLRSGRYGRAIAGNVHTERQKYTASLVAEIFEAILPESARPFDPTAVEFRPDALALAYVDSYQ